MITKYTNLLFIFLSLTMFGGCAVGTTELRISHNELNEVSTKKQGNILLKPLVDTRPNTTFIGNKRNAYGMVLGHVGIQENKKLDEILTEYFAETLERAGYKVTIFNDQIHNNNSTNDFDALIEGNILEFWMDLYMTVWHKIKLNIQAINPTNEKLLWEKEIAGSQKRVLWVGATGEFERIVREALTNTLNTALEEFSSDEFYYSLRESNDVSRK